MLNRIAWNRTVLTFKLCTYAKLNYFDKKVFWNLILCMAHSDWAVEYTDCFSTVGLDSPNKCPRYDTKQSDGEVPVMLEL